MDDARIAELERYEAEAREMRGWQLRYEPEPSVAGPPWDYEARARALLRDGTRVVDLGTGGGEVFGRILLGPRLCATATEPWGPNVPVARRRLLGRAGVAHASSLALPFRARAFDVVLSRHEEIAPPEIARVLAPGGVLLTQQLGPDLWCELGEVFPEMTRFPDHQKLYRDELRARGLAIANERAFRRSVRFRELGHLVYQLVVAPWTVPGFGVRSHLPALEALDARCRSEGGLALTESFYLLEARARWS